MNYSDPYVKQASSVVQSFLNISRLLTKFTMQNAASLGLTLHQMGILNIINSHPNITLKEITEKLQIPKSTVSINVDELVNLDLIDRKTNSNNRREINLTSTAKGKEKSLKSSENALSYRAMMAALEKLPEDTIQNLIKTHEELLAHLQTYASEL